MAQSPQSILADIVRCSRAFVLQKLAADAIELRPKKPRVRGPLTPLAKDLLRSLTFQFENVLTGLCNPSLHTLARATGCSDSSAKRLLPELRKAGYVHWRPGKRKRVWTRKGWREVRAANCYQLTCPQQYLAELRAWLTKIYQGRHGPHIQTVVSRVTPLTEATGDENATAKTVASCAAALRPYAAQPTNPAPPIQDTAPADHPRTTGPPANGPPEPQGGVEIGGVQVEDPKLGSVLSGLWAAMERREGRGQ